MNWSLRLGSFRGIAVHLHLTFLLLLGYLAVTSWTATRSVEAAFLGVFFFVLLFACVLLHEFGHALMAARFGVRTRNIVLYPIGGVARLERMPEKPGQELAVALAGPAVNVIIFVGLYLWLQFSGALVPVDTLGWSRGPLVERLMVVNVFLVLFNLIPAFPMDGGRVLRALLAMRLDYARATRVAARIGQALAVVFGLAGMMWNPFLMFIAFFVWVGAAQENAMVQRKSAQSGLPLHPAVQTEFETLEPSDEMLRAVQLTLAGNQQDFPVLSGGRMVGLLCQEDMLRGLHEVGSHATVSDAMQLNFTTAHVGESAQMVLARMVESECRTLPVTDMGGRLVGMVTVERLAEFLRIHGR